MMKLLSFAALTYVAAAEVPVFSSNDDYDEINLNIRLLSQNVTGAPANVSASYVVSGSLTSSYVTEKTVDGLCGDVAAPTAAALESTTGAAAGSCTINSCAAPAAAASRARKLQAASVSIEQAYAITFTTVEAANSAATVVNDEAFASTFATALNSELASAGTGLTATVDSATASVTVVVDTTAAPAPAVAAPSPSPSSDATMVKANVALAAVAALFASMF